MSRPNLLVVSRNGMVAPHAGNAIEDDDELVEEIDLEQRGLPEFKFFTASSEEELVAKLTGWRDAEVIGNSRIDGVVFMSPTVSDDGIWRTTVNYLLFEDDLDPWS